MVVNFFLQLILILFLARLFGEAVARFKIPSVIGELIAGIIIGPSLLNFVQPTETVKLLADIGIILLLFEVGLETDLMRIAKIGYKAFLVAIGGVIIPFILGFVISYYGFELNLITSLFIGATLTATSIGITIRILKDLKRHNAIESQIVLGAAVIDDIIGIVILSVLYKFAISNKIDILESTQVLGFILLFLILSPFIVKLISFIIEYYEKKSEIPGLLSTMVVSVILLFAWLAKFMGAPELLGGFAAGVALSDRFVPFKKLRADKEFPHKVEVVMKPIIHLFTPIFFVTIGLSLNLKEVSWGSSFVWILTILILIAAFVGKLASGFFTYKVPLWMKFAIGLAMIPRGEVGLIFVNLGKNNNIFNQEIYAAMILVIAITTILTPLLMRLFYSYVPTDSV